MALESLLDRIPEYAKDLRINLSNLLKASGLTPQQMWGTVAACAMASRHPVVRESLLEEAGRHLSPEAFAAAQTAASLMGMNNVYYRFLHLSEHEAYRQIPARLRMQGLRGHGVDHNDFELWCTAVSALNGCGTCMASHERGLRDRGIGEDTVLAAVRIASVIHGIATAV